MQCDPSCSLVSDPGVRALLFFYFLFLQQSLAFSKCSWGSELLALGEQVHSITPCLAFLFLNTLGTARLWKEEVRRTEAVVRDKEFKRVLPFLRVIYPEFPFVS